MRTISRMLAPLAVAGVLVGASAAPAQASQVVLDDGHVDVLDIGFAGGDLVVGVLAYGGTNSPGWHDPADVTLDVPPDAALTIPPSWDICAQGTSWVLPQNDVSGLLWAGWNAHDVDAGDVTGDQVTVTLKEVDGPQGSDGFCVFSASAGQVSQVYVDSDDLGDPSGQLSFGVSEGAHAHPNWAFDVAGTYEVTLEVTATRASDSAPITSGEHVFTFEVRD